MDQVCLLVRLLRLPVQVMADIDSEALFGVSLPESTCCAIYRNGDEQFSCPWP